MIYVCCLPGSDLLQTHGRFSLIEGNKLGSLLDWILKAHRLPVENGQGNYSPYTASRFQLPFQNLENPTEYFKLKDPCEYLLI